MKFLSLLLAAMLATAPFCSAADADDAERGIRSALPGPPHGMHWVCDLDVDTDRDGVVEPAGPEDDPDEARWSDDRGAVFLFNNDDDDDDLDGLVDAEDHQVNGAADALDLAPIMLRAMPCLPAGWFGELKVDQASAAWVRLFRKQDENYSHFDPASDNPIPAADLRTGMTFGIEALDFARRPADFARTASGAPGGWDGDTLVTFILKDGSGIEQCRDTVRLRVAPFLLYSNLAPGETAYVVEKSYTTAFITALQPCVAAGGAALDPIDGIVTGPSYDIWAQDAMEFGYASMPAPGGPHTLPAVLRSPRDWGLDAWTRDHGLRPDFGYIFKGDYRSGVDWIDWFGNLDCTPPLPGWPLGRIYTGYQGATTMHPAVLAFFEAQGLQGPVLQINTDWLLIGHVDEEISFVPADTGTEYRMLMPGTVMALQILQDLQDAGKGHLAVFQGTDDQTTVNGLLSWSTFVNYNNGLQADIDGVRQEMKNGLGIAEEDIIDIPALFWKAGGGNRAVAHMPNMVNALVLGDHFITSDPFGPVDGSIDQFKQPVIQALTAIGLTVDFVDDWYPYHEWWGEVHCGTNAVRTPPADPWWNTR